MRITRIPRQRDLHKKRVAAYCRVSTLLEEQEESFDAQVKYYTRFIKAHEDWEFAGIYSDEKSGRKTANRPGLRKWWGISEGDLTFFLERSSAQAVAAL